MRKMKVTIGLDDDEVERRWRWNESGILDNNIRGEMQRGESNMIHMLGRFANTYISCYAYTQHWPPPIK